MKDDDSYGKPAGGRREPVFTDFDEEEDYEESERDTDYASAYEEDSADEDELEPLEDDDPDILSADWQVLGGGSAGTGRNPWAAESSRGREEEDTDSGAGEYDSESESELFTDYDEEADEYPLEDDEGEDEYPADDDWDERKAYADEPDAFEDGAEESAQGLPLGLIIVGLVALALLAAGGYGVIQQRAAAQQEIRQLQASLATAASPAEVVASREALREMEQRAAENKATIDTLTLENRRLSDIVDGLEGQLAAQKAAAAKPAATPGAAKTAPKPPSAAAERPGKWFVNFSSYTQRSVAESWVKKLKPSAGKAMVVPGSKDGTTFYRVRITGLADRAQAEKVAGQLQSTHHLPSLWVGSE